MPATKKDLEEMIGDGCGVEGCGHDHEVLYLHARCHLHGRIEVSYRKGSGLLRVGCMECGKIVASIKVSET